MFVFACEREREERRERRYSSHLAVRAIKMIMLESSPHIFCYKTFVHLSVDVCLYLGTDATMCLSFSAKLALVCPSVCIFLSANMSVCLSGLIFYITEERLLFSTYIKL